MTSSPDLVIKTDAKATFKEKDAKSQKFLGVLLNLNSDGEYYEPLI